MAKKKNDNLYMPVKFPGRPLKYTPDQLREKFAEYVQWAKDNPLEIVVRTDYANGNYAENTEKKPRYISLNGFQLFIGCDERWWGELDKSKRFGPEFSAVKASIKKYCEEYQKEMASSGVFKENIISRLLGLADKKQVDGNLDFQFKFGGEQ